MLSEQEESALRALPEFRAMLARVKAQDEYQEKLDRIERESRKNEDGTWKHDDPNKNPNREDGLYGKAAQAADGDWYSSH